MVNCRLSLSAQEPGEIPAEYVFGVGVADSMTKVFIRDMPVNGLVPIAKEQTLELAQNEWESLQIVVAPTRDLKNVRVRIGTFRAADGTTLPAAAVTSSVVGFVKTEQPPYKVPYVGWWPDPILDFQKAADAKVGELLPFWIRVHAPKTAQPGVYKGQLMVEADDAPPVPVQLSIRVFDFAVPDMSYLPTATSFRDYIRLTEEEESYK